MTGCAAVIKRKYDSPGICRCETAKKIITNKVCLRPKCLLLQMLSTCPAEADLEYLWSHAGYDSLE